MATANARGGRRRWMLHEEARAAAEAAQDEPLLSEATGRTYDFDAASLSYSVATRLLPQRLWALWAVLVAGLAIVAGLALLDGKATAVREWLGVATMPAAQWSSPASLGAWFSNLTLTTASLLCLLIYGLRRHRLDDYHGKYRRWLGASVALALASLILATGLHQTFAESLAKATGMSALPSSAIWWLVPTGLVGGLMVARIALDMRPCRLGLFALAMSVGLYLAALAAHFELLPVAAADVLLPPAAQCAGHLWLVVSLLAQIRFIQLEAAGIILSPAVAVVKAKSPLESSDKPIRQPAVELTQRQPRSSDAPEPPKPAPTRASEKASPPPVVAKSNTRWIDGRTDRDDDDEEEGRPLSKAERKRLRKEAHHRAA